MDFQEREKEGESKKNTKPILLLSKTTYFFLIKAFKFWRRLTFCSCDQNLLSHRQPLCSGLALEVPTAKEESLIPVASVVVVKPINIPLAGTLTLMILNMLKNVGYS